MEKEMSVYEKLSAINVNDKKSKKNNLDYLSWAYAWGEVKKFYPKATHKIYKNDDNWNYHTDGRTAWVEVGVTIEGIEHIENLPVMDYRNKSIPLEKITSMDVNKAIQRCLVKAIARHGLGLYIYKNEDLPDMTEEQEQQRMELSLQAKYKAVAQKRGYPNMEDFEGKTSSEITAIMKKWQEAKGE